jgi:hypothetical protein
MTFLRALVATSLALSVTLASAQGSAPGTIEQRLQQLEAEQAAMKQQLAERDAVIQELRKELQAGGGATAPSTAPAAAAAPAPAAGRTAEPVVAQAGPPGSAPAASEPTGRIETWGFFDPGKGFLVGRNDYGQLSLSGYAMLRYMSQHDEDQVFTDHLGRERPVDPREDFFSHRIMVFLTGWMVDPKLVYTIFLWTVNTTDQNAIFANIGYQFSRKFSLYGGIAGNPGSRSLLGSHPYWLGHDRVMADEFFRPYFAQGLWAQGEVLPGLWYSAMVSNSNSALGVTASTLDRKLTTGGSLWWMPTTNEFGPRGGYGDFEFHEQLATRFGVSFTDSPEQSFRNDGKNASNTTLRLADSVNLFETGALAPGVTIDEADYRVLAMDAGIKYRGFFLQAEYYQRWLDNFQADGLLPVGSIKDTGFYVQTAFFPIPKKIELYAATSQIYGDDRAGFGDSSEYILGMNYYPFQTTRNHRLNLQFMDVNNSPASSTFGYYVGGQDGWTLASSFSIFF